jgi:RNA recognition motif-containing protein
MREFFSQFGKVIDSTVMLDRETGRSKGFGFVSFEDTNVQPFLGFGNLEIDGKLVRLSSFSLRKIDLLILLLDRRQVGATTLPTGQLPSRRSSRSSSW